MSIKVPQIFENLKGKDAKFELVQSPTLQSLKMILSHNIVTKKIAYVFINSECRGIPYKNALIRGKNAYRLFDEIFEFEEVHTLRDPSINIIEDTIDRMQAQAQDFERRVLERN